MTLCQRCGFRRRTRPAAVGYTALSAWIVILLCKIHPHASVQVHTNVICTQTYHYGWVYGIQCMIMAHGKSLERILFVFQRRIRTVTTERILIYWHYARVILCTLYYYYITSTNPCCLDATGPKCEYDIMGLKYTSYTPAFCKPHEMNTSRKTNSKSRHLQCYNIFTVGWMLYNVVYTNDLQSAQLNSASRVEPTSFKMSLAYYNVIVAKLG